MKLTFMDIYDLSILINKEVRRLEGKAAEWYGDDEDDKSPSLMALDKIDRLNELKNKLNEV